ncbi:DnaD domain-containing protein [Carnobacterium maltaromaticum]|uniref:DnaD domain-containing protein n=1 Tax=Carnobacterium maltaromaticum TaxID=2751 RepID=UPI001E643BD4|nr:DnaD domain protein [Carnobacterium maltaromaticum]
MAIYRQLHTTFWQDNFIGDCTKDQKLFFLYLISNSNTTQCGAYEFNNRYAQFELGMSGNEVQSHLDFFVKNNKIRYHQENNEVLLVNWLKYNSARSPKVAPVIDKELKDLKTVEFKSEVVKNCLEYGYPIKTKINDSDIVPIPYEYNTDTILQPEPTQNHHQHNNQQQQQQEKNAAANPFDFYQNNFGILNPTTSETIGHWVDDIGNELVVESMRRAAIDQKGFRYAEGIMKNWVKSNVKSLEDVEAQDIAFINSQKSKRTTSVKTETLPDWVENPVTEEKAMSPEDERLFKERIAKLQSSQ